MSEARFVGRFSVTDASRRVGDAVGGMQHILTAHGEHMTAERDGADLKIYQHTDAHGLPVRKFGNEEGTVSQLRSTAGVGLGTGTGDARPNPRQHVGHAESDQMPRSIADLRALHDAHFSELRNSGRREGDEVHIHLP